jgi:multidrug efflux system outer membrane protein
MARYLGLRIVLCAIGAALGGCTAIVPASPPSAAVAIPLQWSVPVAGEVPTALAQWWRRFDDPLLVALLDDALARNNSIIGARAALAQARAQSDLQAAGLRPVVSAGAGAQRARQREVNVNTFNAAFDASWELDVFGGQRAAVRAADATAAASAASLADIQVSVAAEVALDYLSLRALRARLAIAQDGLRSQEQTQQLTAWRVQAGLLTALELDQARAATEQTRAQIPALQSAVAQAESGLAVLTGRAPGALRARLALATDAPAAFDAAVIADVVPAVPARTLRQRPDVRAAEAQVAAAAAQVTQADAARLPDFSLGGSLGSSALTVGALPNAAALVASLFARIAAPVIDGGAGRARVRAQQALLDQAGANYAATVLVALKDVEDSLVAVRNEAGRLASLRAAAAAAANAATLANQRYRSGVVDFQVVLDTERVRLAAQDAVAVSAGELNADHIRLYKALGGGWEPASATAPASVAGITKRDSIP